MEILRVENISRVYGKGPTQVKALDGVSFSVRKGEFIAIVGASGSGKSTLMHIIGGVDRPTSGKVYRQYRYLQPECSQACHLQEKADRPYIPVLQPDTHFERGRKPDPALAVGRQAGR